MTYNILITGGAGYIGSLLAFKLIKEGHSITLYDNLLYQQDLSLSILHDMLTNNISVEEGILRSHPISFDNFKHFKFINGDIRDREKLEKLFSENKFDFIFHLAELVGYYACEKDVNLTKEINFGGTKLITDLVKKHGGVLIYNSSSSIYGSRENPDEILDEDAYLPLDKLDTYCMNKIFSENYIKEEGRKNPSFKYVLLRPATVGGLSPRMRLTLFPNHFTYAALIQKKLSLTEPNNYRVIIDLNDLIESYISIVNAKEIYKGVFNIGCHNMTKKQYVDEISKILEPEKIEINSIEKIGNERNLRISSEKFKKYYGFEAKKAFSETVKPLVSLLKKNPEVFSKDNFKGVINTSLEEWKLLLS